MTIRATSKRISGKWTAPAHPRPLAPPRGQRRRDAGWRAPAGAICVTRPSKYGNPYRVGETAIAPTGEEITVRDAAHAVRLYSDHLAARPDLVAAARAELADKLLLCWCAVGEPCHADVLRRVANSRPESPAPEILAPIFRPRTEQA